MIMHLFNTNDLFTIEIEKWIYQSVLNYKEEI